MAKNIQEVFQQLKHAAQTSSAPPLSQRLASLTQLRKILLQNQDAMVQASALLLWE